MKIGLFHFAVGGGITPGALAAAAEERGFESLWFAEHSHIPADRQSPWPGGAELPEMYYEAMDPVVAISHAAATTSTIGLGFGIALVIQRDIIQFAKSLASLGALAGDRLHVGVGAGWNIEEMANHGTDPSTRFGRMRESVEALRVLLGGGTPEYHGKHIDFDPVHLRPMLDHVPTFHVAGAAPHGLRRALAYGDGWMPIGGRPDADLDGWAAARRAGEEETGRSIEFSIYGASPGLVERCREAGADRVMLGVPSVAEDEAIAYLDELASVLD